MSSEVSESSAVLPFLVAGVFPFTFIIGYGNTEIHPRKSPEFWTWFCSRNTIGSWLSESIIPAVKWSPLPVGSGTRGPKMTRWQSHSPVHWNHCCALKRNHSSLQTSTDHYCTDGRKNCCKKVIQFNSERSHSHSNSWCLGSCVLAVDERAPNVGYWPEHTLCPVTEPCIFWILSFNWPWNLVLNGTTHHSIGPAASGQWATW